MKSRESWADNHLKAILLIFCGWAAGGLPLAAADAAVSAPSKNLSVAAVQMRSSWDLADNARRIRASIRECAAKGARVAVFPECALSGYSKEALTNLTCLTAEQLAQAESQLTAACREAGIYAIVGMLYRDGSKLFNSAAVISPEGKVIERYHKIHLTERWSTPGEHLSVFRIDGVPCSIIICHDSRYPELVRLPVLAGARVIFYVSCESGLLEEQKLNPYRAQVQARAVENTVYVVQANTPANQDATGSHGQSRIVGPDGNILQEGSIFGEEVLAAKLDLAKATGEKASGSLKRGLLQDWWREGVKRVRLVE